MVILANVRPFKCVRPAKDKACKIAALPYDVYNRKEACEVVKKEPLSFLRIDRAETQFDDSVSTYDKVVYLKARSILDEMINNGDFVVDETPKYYIYELTMNGRAQTGIVACSSIDDYTNNVIKKHENTREEKEQDRINHVDYCDAQTGPIFLAYRSNSIINDVVDATKNNEAIYDFVSSDDIRHRAWAITNKDDEEKVLDAFKSMNEIYIADGHHRAASAVKVGLKRRKENPGYKGDEEFNFFLSVLFPDDQLMIMDYNRVVKDLNGYSKDEFIEKVKEKFVVTQIGKEKYSPKKKNEVGMFLDGSWYKLEAKDEIINTSDPVEALDVSVLQKNVLEPILNIKDPRTDSRIDFIGGIRGLEELEKRVNEDMTVAFAMYPTSMKELFDVADASMLMPPKSTWVEPKLRSGLFIHKLS